MKKPRLLDSQALFDYALRALGARAHSTGELRQKLMRRAEREEDIPGILDRLKEMGYLNDSRYAESLSASRLENEGVGRARVLRDLRKRRIAPALAEKAVEQTYRETDETALVEAYLRRKYRNVVLGEYLAEPKHLASAYRRLRMAGFSSQTSLTVLKKFAREPEVLDGIEDAPEE